MHGVRYRGFHPGRVPAGRGEIELARGGRQEDVAYGIDRRIVTGRGGNPDVAPGRDVDIATAIVGVHLAAIHQHVPAGIQSNVIPQNGCPGRHGDVAAPPRSVYRGRAVTIDAGTGRHHGAGIAQCQVAARCAIIGAGSKRGGVGGVGDMPAPAVVQGHNGGRVGTVQRDAGLRGDCGCPARRQRGAAALRDAAATAGQDDVAAATAGNAVVYIDQRDIEPVGVGK